MALRFHLDEHIPRAVAMGLKARGFDVTTTVEANLQSDDDLDHLEFAKQHQRVIVTHDHDFLVLHAQGNEHEGICYCHQDKYGIGQLIHRLLDVDATYTQEQMRGRLEFL